ncbi:DoxX-like family protein [Geomicrobium sp. JCM 19039]|uniref:DoxX-like family protein n=1 Tax=Geomicrobium sp. JCM 19039 TaxID=1460636 RepID=UPI00045F163E|nr:DoxX-like family protein [Geomicrobium sp. JCM 19039]GAK12838.1 hypothetical protein JCM19039_2642 [Geomicrobium sp. JCM 19039]
MQRKPVYVETKIDTDMDTLWRTTQEPHLHERWDLRFTHIDYDEEQSNRDQASFTYETKLAFLKVKGRGMATGDVTGEGGKRTSGLQFSSEMPISLIKKGRGYWQYEDTGEGIRFLTQYDYSVRFGFFGRVIDRFMFRPIIGWATAWSFDAMKIWLEKSIPPEQTLQKLKIHSIICFALFIIFFYQGLVPKLLFPETGELDLVSTVSFINGFERQVVAIIGSAQILWAMLFLLPVNKKVMFTVTAILMVVLGGAAVSAHTGVLNEPFNMVTLNVGVIALTFIGWVNLNGVARARRNKRRP